jgi:hypothetical protein
VPRRTLVWLILGSVLLLGVRWLAAERLGFGDAEALYASYARHPAAGYLDHPGLIGVFARALGAGNIPSPVRAHAATAVLCTTAPPFVALVARSLGATWPGALVAAAAVMLTPMTSIGLFAMTPDLLLLYAWYAAIAMTVRAQRAMPGSLAALAWTLGVGFAAGIAFDAKVSGALLLAGLVLSYARGSARAHLRTLAPWAAMALLLIVVSPVVVLEIERGLPMVRHRLVATQRGMGPSLRNAGALVGGQLAYLTPPVLWGVWLLSRDLWRRRRDDAETWLLVCVTAASLPLLLACLFSRVAEPHWPAPIYLGLVLHFARFPDVITTRLARAGAIVAGLATAVVMAWVLLPVGPWLLPGHARYDLANDLYAWPKAMPLVRQALRESAERPAAPPMVVGSHWIVCAQVHAALPGSVLVGCNSPEKDDFDDWLPRAVWQEARVILYVTDSRLRDLDDRIPAAFHTDRIWTTEIRRGGAVVRQVRVLRLIRSAATRRCPELLDDAIGESARGPGSSEIRGDVLAARKGAAYGGVDSLGAIALPHPFEQHRAGEHRGDGVGDPTAGDVRGRAVDGLENGRRLADVRARCDPQTTDEPCRQVAQDVAEQVGRDDHVEAARVACELHRAVVDDHVAESDVRILGRYFLADLQE